MSNNPFERTELTRDDIKALRKCDRLTIEYKRPLSGSTEPAPAMLTCIKTSREPLERNLEYRFPVRCTTSAAMPYWRADATQLHVAYARAEMNVYHDQTCPVSSALSILRAGDRVSILIDANGQSQSVDEAGISVDTVTLAIERDSGKSVKRWNFVLDRFAVPHNSSIRICRVEAA